MMDKDQRNGVLVIIVIATIIFVFFYALGVMPPELLPTACLAQAGYTCMNLVAHDNILGATLGQTTGSIWSSTYFLWVPKGYGMPNNTAPFCPSPKASSISGGISCYDAGPMRSGQTISANFTFDAPVVAGQGYSGAMWAQYQDPAGTWETVQIATVAVKAA